MRKKLLCTVAAVAMLSGLFAVAATPASAAPPSDTANFHPDDDTDNHESGILSDRFDGVDSTAHLTNVSTTDTAQVEWRLCASGTVATDTDEELTQSEFDACTIVIGTDMAPTTPAGDPPANVDEAYEFNWNIPGTEDGATRDLVAAACTGSGRDVENDPSPTADERTCVLDVENDILLDDAQTATPQTDSGEIVSICTTDVDGPGVGNDLCTRGGTGAGTNAQVDARFSPFEHGDNVPNEGFVFRARTSDNVDQLNIDIEVADATNDPNHLGDEGGTCTNIFTGTNFIEYECEVSDLETPDDAELSLGITSHGSAQEGLCAPGVLCVLDNHYVVSNARRAETVVATFASDPDLSAEEQCDSPDQAETNDLGDNEVALFCVDDQFGQPFDTNITFESDGPSSAGFDSSADCTAVSHDNDAAGVDEHCDGSTGSDGIAATNAQNPDDFNTGEAAIRGVQTITACVETEPNPDVAAHGCQDEPANLTDSVDKTWESQANEITLVYGDKSANCRTGPTFRENQVGDQDNLLACVFDAFGNPTPTTGTDDGFLEWSIGSGNDDEVDTQYVGTQPSETDTDGEAVATIEAIDPGSDNPTVTLRNENTGNPIDFDSVTKNVTGVPPPDERADSNVSIRHRGRPHRFVGRVTSPDDSCEPGRRVAVRRVRPGRDPVIGRDTTNANGRYRVNHNRTRRRFRYYARVRGNADCLGDRSPNTPRVR